MGMSVKGREVAKDAVLHSHHVCQSGAEIGAEGAPSVFLTVGLGF